MHAVEAVLAVLELHNSLLRVAHRLVVGHVQRLERLDEAALNISRG